MVGKNLRGGLKLNKYIEKATLKIVQRMEQNRKEFVEAEASYSDTANSEGVNNVAHIENGVRRAPFETFPEHHERAWSDEPYSEEFLRRCREKALEYNNEEFIGASLLHEIKLAVPMHYRGKVLEGTMDLSSYEQHLKEIRLRV